MKLRRARSAAALLLLLAAPAANASEPAAPGAAPLLLHAAPAAHAGTEPAPPRAAAEWRFSLREDARRLASPRVAALLAAGGALAGLALAVEDPSTQERQMDVFQDLPDWGNAYGSPSTVLGGASALALAGAVAGRPRLVAAGVDLARAFGYSALIVGGAKAAFGRERPDGGRYSFPSGHTAAAFSTAPVLAHHFGPWIGGAAYAMGVATAGGRMEDRRHYLSDVVFGAAVGFAVSDAIAAQRARRAARLVASADRVALEVRF